MDNNLLSGRSFGQRTTATRDEQGYWKLHVMMEEEVSYPDGTVRRETLESECMDKEFNVAHGMALGTVLAELDTLVYSRGFDSLIEGIDYQRKLEAENAAGSKTDEDTPTQ